MTGKNHQIVSQLEKAVTEARPYDHDLEGALGQYLNKPSSDVVEKVIDALYGLNGSGIPYFVEKLAPRLGLDPKKIDEDKIAQLIGKYGIAKEMLKGLITANDRFDAGTVSQITTQLASQLAAEFLEGVPAQVGNLAYKDRTAAVDVVVAMQGFLRGPAAAANIRRQLQNALTPDRIQAVATGVVENAYTIYKEVTRNLYQPEAA